MVTPSSIIRIFDVRHIGIFPTCIRISFPAMCFAWLLVLGALTLLDLNAKVLISVTSIALTLHG